MHQCTVKRYQPKVLDVQSQIDEIYIISFFSGILLSVDSFQKLSIAYHDLLQKIQIF